MSRRKTNRPAPKPKTTDESANKPDPAPEVATETTDKPAPVPEATSEGGDKPDPAPEKTGNEPLKLSRKVKISPNGYDVFVYGPGEVPEDTPPGHIAQVKKAYPDAIDEE